MAIAPNHILLHHLARARQATLHAAASGSTGRRSATSMRVRVGHLLIGLGAAISGEQRDARPRRTAAGRPA